jgi:hypothetical protein
MGPLFPKRASCSLSASDLSVYLAGDGPCDLPAIDSFIIIFLPCGAMLQNRSQRRFCPGFSDLEP